MPRILLAAIAALLLLPAAAQANGKLLSLVQDDDLLVYRDDATRDRALQQIKDLGADGVRVTLLWEVVAENARDTPAQKRRFARLGADDPRAYPRLNWDRYDRLVRASRNLGLTVLFNVTGPGPRWAHTAPPKQYARYARTWKPRPAAFELFVRAVGKRFSGTYRDENENRVPVPRVSTWSVWNEPNQGGWLTPQNVGGRPTSPALYRDLWVAGAKGLARSGHRGPETGDVIMMGETAPTGVKRRTVTSAVAPKTFIRGVFCVGTDGRPRNGAGCSLFDKEAQFRPAAWAHHPYTKNVSPLQRPKSANDVTMANIGDLGALLDQIAAGSGRLPAGVGTASTEFGFETNPPDVRFGVSLQQQADWNVLGDLIAVKDPRLIANTQFLLRDVAPNRRFTKGSRNYWLTYQSGLLSRGGTPKPAARAYAFPFLAVPVAVTEGGGRSVAVWGMLRFRPNAPGDTASVQWRPAGSAPTDWRTIGDPFQATEIGAFEGSLTMPGPGVVRAVWTDGSTGLVVPSLEVALP